MNIDDFPFNDLLGEVEEETQELGEEKVEVKELIKKVVAFVLKEEGIEEEEMVKELILKALTTYQRLGVIKESVNEFSVHEYESSFGVRWIHYQYSHYATRELGFNIDGTVEDPQ